MGWNVVGKFATIKANKSSHWHYIPTGSAFVGPIAVVPNIYAANNAHGNNFGTMTVSNIKISAIEGNSAEPGAFWPVSFKYFFTLTNDSSNPLVYNAAIGTF